MSSPANNFDQFGRPKQEQRMQTQEFSNNRPASLQQAFQRLSKEEIQILEECNKESFYSRSLPLSTAFGGATFYLVKAGFLKPHPRFGPTLKTLGAVLLGYMMGKLSYRSICEEKILTRIPNSALAESVRKRRGILPSDEVMRMDLGSGPGPAPYAEPYGGGRRETRADSQDLTPPSFDTKELDDSLRPSVDREVRSTSQDEAPPHEPARTLTYRELRRQNRSQVETPPPLYSPGRERAPDAPQRSLAPGSEGLPAPAGSQTIWDKPHPRFQRGERKNIYGDILDS